MFPQKIKDLLAELRIKTDEGNIAWSYDDDSSRVSTGYKGNTILLKYNFNENKEVGEFFLKVTNKGGKEYFFGADQEYPDDYELARKLYDIAQSTDLDIDLD